MCCFEKNITSCSSTVNDSGLHCKGTQCLEDVGSACSHSRWNEWVGLASEPLIFTTPLPCTPTLPGRDTGAHTHTHNQLGSSLDTYQMYLPSCWYRMCLLSPLFSFTLFFNLALHSPTSVAVCQSRAWLSSPACPEAYSVLTGHPWCVWSLQNRPVVFAWCSSQKKRPPCGLLMSFTLFMADKSQGILLLYHYFSSLLFCSILSQHSFICSTKQWRNILWPLPVSSAFISCFLWAAQEEAVSLSLSLARSLTLWVCVYLCPYLAYSILSLSLPFPLFSSCVFHNTLSWWINSPERLSYISLMQHSRTVLSDLYSDKIQLERCLSPFWPLPFSPLVFLNSRPPLYARPCWPTCVLCA